MKLNTAIHQYGLHSPGTGGAYNAIWSDFIGKNDGMKDNPYYVIGFGVGLIDKISPFAGL